MVKKISVALVMIIFLLGASKVTFAHGIDETIRNDIEEIVPRYVVSCTHSSGKHLMDGRGWGKAFYGSVGSNDLRIDGFASQCRYCNLVLITENNPFWWFTTYWGYYATWNPNYEVSNNVIMYTQDFRYASSNGDSYVQGFRFN